MVKSESKARRGRPKAMSDEQRRALIVSQAERLFLDKGYGGTSTEEIASCCRMSKQTLYRLFPGKPELFVEVLKSKELRMIEFGENDYDDLPLDEAICRLFMVDLDQEAYENRASFLRVTQTEATNYPELNETLHQREAEKTRTELAAWLERQCGMRGLYIENARSAAHMLMDVFLGAVIFDAIGGFGWGDPEQRISHFRHCAKVFLHGIAPAEDAC